MADKVSIPDNADEAAAMMRVAAHWMQANAPEMLRAILRATEDAKDAERYRWLRNQGDRYCTEKDGYGGETLKMGDCLDSAVDAAMAAAPAVGAA